MNDKSHQDEKSGPKRIHMMGQGKITPILQSSITPNPNYESGTKQNITKRDHSMMKVKHFRDETEYLSISKC